MFKNDLFPILEPHGGDRSRQMMLQKMRTVNTNILIYNLL